MEVENLAKSFDKTLFEKLSYILEAGQRLAIIGPNGAGKSTLLKLLAGAFDEKLSDIKPDAGCINGRKKPPSATTRKTTKTTSTWTWT